MTWGDPPPDLFKLMQQYPQIRQMPAYDGPPPGSNFKMRVEGYCPMGCGDTLIVGVDETLTCSDARCLDPLAAHKLISDPETEHIVWFTDYDFTIRHPMRERINDELLDCELTAHIGSWDGPPSVLGKHRAINLNGTWAFEIVEEENE